MFKRCAQHHQPINHRSSLSCCNFDWVNSQDLMFASGEMRAASLVGVSMRSSDIKHIPSHTYIISLYHYIYTIYTYFRNHGTKDRWQWSTNSLCCFVFHMFFSTDLVISPPNSPPIQYPLLWQKLSVPSSSMMFKAWNLKNLKNIWKYLEMLLPQSWQPNAQTESLQHHFPSTTETPTHQYLNALQAQVHFVAHANLLRFAPTSRGY